MNNQKKTLSNEKFKKKWGKIFVKLVSVCMCTILSMPLLSTTKVLAHHNNGIPPEKIMVNQSGYNLNLPKRFTAPLASDQTTFIIKRVKDEEVVFDGSIQNQVGDFSAFNPVDIGEYYIEAGGERSVPFTIGPFWMEKVSYQPALNFMIDSRSWIGDVMDSTETGVGWRDGHQFSFEIPTLVLQYLSNPIVYEQMPRQITYGGRNETPTIMIGGFGEGAQRDASDVQKKWSGIPAELSGLDYMLVSEKDRSLPPFEQYRMYSVKSEQPTTIYAIVDEANLPVWIASDGWNDTSWTVQAENGNRSVVYSKSYDAGLIDLKRGMKGNGTTYVFSNAVELLEAPDIVELIKFGAEMIYVQNGKHTLLKEQLAYFLYAYPYLQQWVSEDRYESILQYAVTLWGDSDKGSLYWHDTWHAKTPHTADLFQTYTQIGTIKGELPPGHSVVPNLLMHDVAKREGLSDAERYFDAAYNQTEWLIEHLDWKDPDVTKGQRMSEYVTAVSLAHFAKKYPDQAPPGLIAKLIEWASVMVDRSQNMWDFRKYTDDQWVPIELFPHDPAGWNEPGNVAGFPAPALAVAEVIGEGELRNRLVELAMSHFDHTFGRNPYNRHFSHDANRDYKSERKEEIAAASIEQPLTAGWDSVKGNWEVKDTGVSGENMLQSTAATSTSDMLIVSKMLASGLVSDRYAIEADYRIQSGDNASGKSGGLVFHYIDSGNYYHFRLNRTGAGVKQVQLYKWVNNTAKLIKEVSFDWTSDAWNHMKIELNGSRIHGYVNEQLLIDVEDNTFSDGKIGFRGYGTTVEAKQLELNQYHTDHEVEYGWFDEYIGGFGKLQGVRGVLDASPKNHAYPYQPDAKKGYTEGWIAFNTAWNAALSYLTLHESEVQLMDNNFTSKQATVTPGSSFGIRLQAPLNMDYERIEQGRVTFQASNGDRESIIVTESGVNSSFFDGIVSLSEGTATAWDGQLQVEQGGWFTMSYGYGDYATVTRYIWNGEAFELEQPTPSEGLFATLASSTRQWKAGEKAELRVMLTNASDEMQTAEVQLQMPAAWETDQTLEIVSVPPKSNIEITFTLEPGTIARSAELPVVITYGEGKQLVKSYKAALNYLKTEENKAMELSQDYNELWSNVTGTGGHILLEDGSYAFEHQVQTNSTMLAIINNGQWHDFKLQADVQLMGTTGNYLGGLVFRYLDQNNYYSLRLNSTGNAANPYAVDLLKVASGQAQVLQTAPFAWIPGEWYTMQIEAKDDQLNGYINGEKLLEVTDSHVMQGAIGFRTYARNQGKALYKNLTFVERTGMAEVPFAAIDELLAATNEAEQLMTQVSVGTGAGQVDQTSMDALIAEHLLAASALDRLDTVQAELDAKAAALKSATINFKQAMLDKGWSGPFVPSEPKSPVEDTKIRKITEKEWKQAVNGQLVIVLEEGQTSIELPIQTALLNEQVSVIVQAAGAVIELPAKLLQQLNKTYVGIGDATYQLKLESEAMNEKQRKALGKEWSNSDDKVFNVELLLSEKQELVKVIEASVLDAFEGQLILRLNDDRVREAEEWLLSIDSMGRRSSGIM